MFNPSLYVFYLSCYKKSCFHQHLANTGLTRSINGQTFYIGIDKNMLQIKSKDVSYHLYKNLGFEM